MDTDVTSEGERQAVERDAPDQPNDLPRRAWPGVLKRTIREFNADHLTDLAAALTYYGVLAIFPMLVVIVSLVGLLGHSVTQSLIHNLSTVAPGTTKQILTAAIKNIQSDRGASGVAFVIGLVAAMWSASGYVAAFMRASNVVWDVEEGRPFLQDAASPAGRHVRHGLGGVRVLRRQLLLLQQDLRRDRLGRDLPRVAVDNEYRDPPRRRAQRRDRARPSDRGRPALREEQVEIAIYLRIETFAAAVGDRDSEVLAARIRREEERMAKYLTAELPRLVKDVVKAEIPRDQRATPARSRRSSSVRSSSSSSRGSAASNGAGTSRSGTRRTTARRSRTAA